MPVPAEFLDGPASSAASSATPPLALVTGGARRIGAAFVRALARDGFRVAIHCNRSTAAAARLRDELAGAGLPPPLVCPADLAARDAGRALFRQLPEAPRVLVNNASLFREDHPGAIDPVLLDDAIAVNLRAPALLLQELLQLLPTGKSALVVNMLDAKLAAPNPDYFSYTLSKFGLRGLTEMAARSFATRGIRVNAIAPAITLVSGQQSAEDFANVHAMNPLRRGVEPRDLVRALSFLVHTPTITGQTLLIDSGQRFLALPCDVAYMKAP